MRQLDNTREQFRRGDANLSLASDKLTNQNTIIAITLLILIAASSHPDRRATPLMFDDHKHVDG